MADTYLEGDAERARGDTPEEAGKMVVAPQPRAVGSLGLNGRRIRHHARLTGLPPIARSVGSARRNTCILV